MHLLEWCSTPPRRSALNHLFSQNGTLSIAFPFSGTAKSHKKPGSALIVSSRTCTTSRWSFFGSTDRSLGINFAATLHTIIQNYMWKTCTDLNLLSTSLLQFNNDPLSSDVPPSEQ
ncbi:hypothetical protein TNCV_814661 [Trichonephila clavipes]|nr:hypothetical protein TNCV_814661 [Trichonephila clavipes]